MNFLAHSLFARGNAERIAGQFCGDFVRGSDLSQYSLNTRVGILMHRQIDAFTDSYPGLVPMRDLFEKPHRRFAGIITDVLFDYFIADDWHAHSTIGFAEHIQSIHNALAEQRHAMPKNLNRFADFLVNEQVFESYQSFDGVQLTLQRLSHRSDRFSVLSTAGDVVEPMLPLLRAGFDDFFPELKRHVAQVRPVVISRAEAMV